MTRPSAPDIRVRRWDGGRWSEAPDAVVMEEPLQLLLDGQELSVVMRTPGQDVELALGLLYAEGIVRSLDDVKHVRISAESGETATAITLDASIVSANATFPVGLAMSVAPFSVPTRPRIRPASAPVPL